MNKTSMPLNITSELLNQFPVPASSGVVIPHTALIMLGLVIIAMIAAIGRRQLVSIVQDMLAEGLVVGALFIGSALSIAILFKLAQFFIGVL